MKTHAAGVFQAAVVRALLCIAVLPLRAQMPAPLLLQAPDALTWQISQRDFHSQTWEASAVVVDPISGKTRVQQHKFIELMELRLADASGLHRELRHVSTECFGHSGAFRAVAEQPL